MAGLTFGQTHMQDVTYLAIFSGCDFDLQWVSPDTGGYITIEH